MPKRPDLRLARSGYDKLRGWNVGVHHCKGGGVALWRCRGVRQSLFLMYAKWRLPRVWNNSGILDVTLFARWNLGRCLTVAGVSKLGTKSH